MVLVETHTSLMSTIITTIMHPDSGPSANVPMSTGTSANLNSRKPGNANGIAKLKIYSTAASAEKSASTAMRVEEKYRFAAVAIQRTS